MLLFCPQETDKDKDKKKEELSERDKLHLEKRYRLPENPHILVHPNRSHKAGKYDCTITSLSSLLAYRVEDSKVLHIIIFWSFWPIGQFEEAGISGFHFIFGFSPLKTPPSKFWRTTAFGAPFFDDVIKFCCETFASSFAIASNTDFVKGVRDAIKAPYLPLVFTHFPSCSTFLEGSHLALSFRIIKNLQNLSNRSTLYYKFNLGNTSIFGITFLVILVQDLVC